MHYVGTFNERSLASFALYEGHHQGYSEATLVDHTSGSVHTGLSIAQLSPQGTLAPHVHSYEESFYILSGDAIVAIGDRVHLLKPGDYGVVKVGTVHGWRNVGATPVRWLHTAAPQPKPPGMERDTFFKKGGTVATDAKLPNWADLQGSLLAHFDVSQILAGSAGAAPGGLKGVFLKYLIDEQFGAIHHRLLFIEYQPGGGIALHDHGYEEAYFILSGEVEAILDGQRYLAKPGTVLWTGTGCVHAFKNISSQPVRWLETFSPQPPKENVFRFMAEWEQRAKELEA